MLWLLRGQRARRSGERRVRGLGWRGMGALRLSGAGERNKALAPWRNAVRTLVSSVPC